MGSGTGTVVTRGPDGSVTRDTTLQVAIDPLPGLATDGFALPLVSPVVPVVPVVPALEPVVPFSPVVPLVPELVPEVVAVVPVVPLEPPVVLASQ